MNRPFMRLLILLGGIEAKWDLFVRRAMLKTMENKKLFEEIPPSRAVMLLALPTILSSLVMVLYNLADTYFVGLLNDPVQSAAVTLAAPVLLAFNAVNNLLGIGTSSVMSRALGKDDYETVKNSASVGFYGALCCGGILALLCAVSGEAGLRILGAEAETMDATSAYLKWAVIFGAVPSILSAVMAYLVRAEGASLHASIGSMSGCLLNILLDPFFVLPRWLGLGAAGAGLATFLSNCIACCYFFALLKYTPTHICIRPSHVQIKWPVVIDICRIGIPAAIQNLLNVVGMTVLNRFTSNYGADAVAAMGIAQRVHLVPFYIALGGAQGVMPLISYNFSQGNTGRMRDSIRFGMRMAVCFMTTVAVGYGLGARWLMAAFIDRGTVISYGAAFLRGLCLALPFLGIDFFAVGIFQACGMGRESLIFAVFRKVLLEIPLLYLLNRLYPLYGLPYAQVLTEIILSAATLRTIARLFKKNYSPNEHIL